MSRCAIRRPVMATKCNRRASARHRSCSAVYCHGDG
ncbi:MAG: CxxxxCH/CxxCH domain-containing protein [Betaproteobacteria bacterium]|nr:MAG: CxxxxCH/CxxCH domain-containing protein [Betaproteobacteria bacterium]TMH51046.1 MAG: CxxxxCH/CxxCH domain-containing protein [Betaproteobacteria bacterium]